MNKTIEYYNANAKAFSEDTLNLEFSEKQDKFIEAVRVASQPNQESVAAVDEVGLDRSVLSPLVLDFGCGSGRDSRYFLSKGLRVDAVDGSEEMCRIASDVLGQPVLQMLFGDLQAESRYDGIWACSSILHLPKAELAEVLGKMHRALKPRGIIYTSFKYGDFEGERHGRYFTNYTEDSFSEMVKEIPGLELIETWTTPDARPGRENEMWLNVLLKRKE